MKHKNLLFLTLILFLPFLLFSKESNSEFQKSVVEVKVSYQFPNYVRPWQYKNPNLRFSKGIVVNKGKEKFILVSAEEILHKTLIEVKKFSSYEYSIAEIVKIDTEANLALLKVLNKDFFNDLKPIYFKNQIKYPSKVKIHYLKNSGDIYTGNGSILSLFFSTSPFGFVELPLLNFNSNEEMAGNGELVVNKKQKAIGLLAYFDENNNTGEIIPNFIIRKFLKNYKKENIFAYKGFKFIPLLDKASKDYYGVKTKNQGVLVSQVLSENTNLKVGDVLLQVESFKIDANGYIEHPLYDKQILSYIFHMGDEWGYSLNKELSLKIIRNKKVQYIDLKLDPFPYSSIKIPYKNEFKLIPYTIQNGFIFMELSKFFLDALGSNWSSVFRKFAYIYDFHKFYRPNEPRDKIVIVSQVLPDIANVGFHDVRFEIVKTINDKPVQSIEHLKREIYNEDSKYKLIKLDNGKVLALDRSRLKEVNERIRIKYGLPKKQ